jgi:hypothetical protein
MITAERGHDAVVEALLAWSDVDPSGAVCTPSSPKWAQCTPLILATANGHEQIVRRLLQQKGIDVAVAIPTAAAPFRRLIAVQIPRSTGHLSGTRDKAAYPAPRGSP